jgi:hypothetical protein
MLHRVEDGDAIAAGAGELAAACPLDVEVKSIRTNPTALD